MSGSSSVTLYSRRHSPSAFDQGFRGMLIQHDILVVEFNIKDSRIGEYEADFLRLSAGQLTIEGMLAKYPSGDAPLFRAIHKSGKQVVLERSPVAEHEFMQYVNLNKRAHQMMSRDLIAAVDLKWKALRQFAAMNARRDVALAQHVARIVLANPGKRVLIYRGPGHKLKLLTELKKNGVACHTQGYESIDPESRALEKLENGDSISPAEILELLSL